jgi:hypothetical protein
MKYYYYEVLLMDGNRVTGDCYSEDIRLVSEILRARYPRKQSWRIWEKTRSSKLKTPEVIA